MKLKTTQPTICVGHNGKRYTVTTMRDVDTNLKALPALHPDTDALLDARLDIMHPLPEDPFPDGYSTQTDDPRPRGKKAGPYDERQDPAD